MIGRWLTTVLSFRLPDDAAIDTLRTIVVCAATMCVVFAVRNWRWLTTDRAIVYGSIGLLVGTQELQQLLTHAPLLVWRLPLLSLQLAYSTVAMRRYVHRSHMLGWTKHGAMVRGS